VNGMDVMKIISIVGARHNFMKIAPFCRALEGTPLPEKMARYRHQPVEQEKWGWMAAASRLSLMERGLEGCMSIRV
jgi:hypothetical protein